MAKDIFGNEMTHDIYGNPLKKKNERQPVSKNQKNYVKITQKGKCYDCRKVLVVEDYHHVKHVSNHGKSTTDNLVALCPECHRNRHTKEAAMKTDKKRSTNTSSGSNYQINLLTGKREKVGSLW